MHNEGFLREHLIFNMEIGKFPLLIFKLKVGIDVQLFNADFNNADYI